MILIYNFSQITLINERKDFPAVYNSSSMTCREPLFSIPPYMIFTHYFCDNHHFFVLFFLYHLYILLTHTQKICPIYIWRIWESWYIAGKDDSSTILVVWMEIEETHNSEIEGVYDYPLNFLSWCITCPIP